MIFLKTEHSNMLFKVILAVPFCQSLQYRLVLYLDRESDNFDIGLPSYVISNLEKKIELLK